MKFFLLNLLFIVCNISVLAQSEKVIGECTVIFNIYIDKSGSRDDSKGIKTLYIKGKQTRVEINGASYNQTIIYDNSTGAAVILKEMGANKFISNFDSVTWLKQNKRYIGMEVELINETKIILGYTCKKANIKLKDGTAYSLYYAPMLLPTAVENPYQVKKIPGLVLEYETFSENADTKIIYTAIKIDLSPVPISKFEIPKKGYRILND